MKKPIAMFFTIVLASTSAIAQSNGSAVVLDGKTTSAANPNGKPSDSPNSPANSITNSSSAESNLSDAQIRPSVKYLGFMYGPGLEFSKPGQAVNNGQDSFMLHSRPKFLVKKGSNFEAGLEARFDTKFLPEGIKASNSNYRLLAAFKNVYKTDTFALGLIPRLMLPTSDKAHNQKMRPSPELITTFDFTPKNTRFSFNGGMVFMKGFYEDGSALNATTFLFQPWMEIDYQLTPNLQLMTAYWPEFTAQGYANRPLAGDSHEIDVGVNWDVVKGWTLIPYVAIEAYSLGDVSSPLKNMQANLMISGTVF